MLRKKWDDLKEHRLNCHFSCRRCNKCTKLQVGLLLKFSRPFFTSWIISWPLEPQQLEILMGSNCTILGKAVSFQMPSDGRVQGQTDWEGNGKASWGMRAWGWKDTAPPFCGSQKRAREDKVAVACRASCFCEGNFIWCDSLLGSSVWLFSFHKLGWTAYWGQKEAK